jgi:sugar phosphate isomerase/epimerase
MNTFCLLRAAGSLLPLLAVAVLLAACVKDETPAGTDAAQGTAFAGNVGVQLYTFRNELAEDVPGTLARVQAMGLRDVEVFSFYGRTAADFKQLLDQHGLNPVSNMAGYERLRDSLDAVIADTKALGARYVVTSWIPHEDPFTREQALAAAADFNAWGARLKAEGLQFGYHLHGYEFQPAGPDSTLFDVLAAATDPQNVAFEMDVFWTVHPGQDPVALLQRYPDRFRLMHVKDMAKGTPTGILTGNAPDSTNVPVGTGMIDYAALLREAERIGNIDYYFIEDEHEAAMEQVPVSLAYLRNLKL